MYVDVKFNIGDKVFVIEPESDYHYGVSVIPGVVSKVVVEGLGEGQPVVSYLFRPDGSTFDTPTKESSMLDQSVSGYTLAERIHAAIDAQRPKPPTPSDEQPATEVEPF